MINQTLAGSTGGSGMPAFPNVARASWNLGLILFALSVFIVTGQARGEFSEPTDVHSIFSSDQTTILNEKSFYFVTHEASRQLEPSVYPIAVKRLLGADRSIVVSGLSTKTHVILVNPHYKLFDEVGQFSSGEFLATTLLMSAHRGDRPVVSGSTVHVSEYGYVALMTPGVNSEGVIIAGVTAARSDPERKIALDLMSDGLIHYAVNQNTLSEVTGLNESILDKVPITGERGESGGQVILNARSAAQIQTAVVNSGGIIHARRLVVQGASVRLEGDVPYLGDTIRTKGNSEDAGLQGIPSESKSVARHIPIREFDPTVASSAIYGTINADKIGSATVESSSKTQSGMLSAALSHAKAVPSNSASSTTVPKKARRSKAANDSHGGQGSKHSLETPLAYSRNDRTRSHLYPAWKQPEWMKYLESFSPDSGNDALDLPPSASRIDQ
jgi:hypothetical protein